MKHLLLIIFLGVLSASPAEAQTSPGQEVFFQRLALFIQAFDNPQLENRDYQAKVFNPVLFNLNKFAQEYPRSRFADDAQGFPLLMLFIGMAVDGKASQGAEKILETMQLFVNKYPDGRFEDETLKAAGEHGSLGIYRAGRDQLLSYMRGLLAMGVKDYPRALAEYSSLKDTIDFSRDTTVDGVLSSEVYHGIIIPYIRLKRLNQAKAAADEAAARFPQYTWPAKVLTLIKALQNKL